MDTTTPPETAYAFDDPENPDFVSGEKIATVAGGTLLAGLIGGGIYFGVAQVYDSLVYVPIGVSLVVAGILSVFFKRAKLRASVPVVVCGVLAGLLAFAFRFELTGLQRQKFLVVIRTFEKHDRFPDADHSKLFAEAKREITPLNVAWVYIDTVAKSGVSIKRGFGSGKGETVDENGYKFRLLVSALICSGGAASVLHGFLHPKANGDVTE
ncbi:MAG: hypothetical protein H7Y38_12535 [Armatimonadetes bacterium]|nr:hypothetical protein [Armatimonadota bacterium]